MSMTIVTVYTLFFDDIRLLAAPISWDNVFYTFSTLSMFVFTVETCLSIYAIDDYFLSFFFWLDFVSTVTMIPDIGWLWDLIVGGSNN